MQIEHLRAFLEIASAGSFLAAAERLHITQSAMSARIKSLEQRLNCQLYIRKRSGIELTESGRRLIQHAQNCVESWERAQQEIALPAEFSSMINMGIQLNLWDRVVQPWNLWMEQNAPAFATRIVSDYSEKLLSLLRDGMLDLVLVYNVRPSANLIIEPFSEEDLILVSTTPRRLNREWTPGYIFVDWSEEFLAQHKAAFPDSPPPKMMVGSAAVGLNHILKHGGSGYFNASDVEANLSSGELHRVEEAPIFKRQSFVVYPKDSSNKESVGIAVDGLKAALSVWN